MRVRGGARGRGELGGGSEMVVVVGRVWRSGNGGRRRGDDDHEHSHSRPTVFLALNPDDVSDEMKMCRFSVGGDLNDVSFLLQGVLFLLKIIYIYIYINI